MMDKNNTTVRKYAIEDIDALLSIAMEEIPKLEHYKGIKVDRERVGFLLRNNVKDESAFMLSVLVGDGQVVGGISAYCVTQLLSQDKTTSDIFMFIIPEWRTLQNAVKLIASYVDWGKRRKATIIRATQTSGYRTDEFDVLLKKYCKFVPIGKVYNYVGD